MNADDVIKWMEKGSKIFLMNIDIKPNQTVLDFGCGKGNFTIPVARIIGEKGKVYAVDKNRKSLDELMKRAGKRGLRNIERVDMPEEIKLPLKNESVDAVLLYDVIHLVDSRRELLTEIYRVSKTNALISVYPKHHQEDMNMSLDDVKSEIESTNFVFERRIYTPIVHDDHFEKDYVLNFRRQ